MSTYKERKRLRKQIRQEKKEKENRIMLCNNPMEKIADIMSDENYSYADKQMAINTLLSECGNRLTNTQKEVIKNNIKSIKRELGLPVLGGRKHSRKSRSRRTRKSRRRTRRRSRKRSRKSRRRTRKSRKRSRKSRKRSRKSRRRTRKSRRRTRKSRRRTRKSRRR